MNKNNKIKEQKTKLETAFVIEQTNYIEYVLKQILVAYISPQKNRTDFLSDIIMHNSMLNFGAKIKAFLYLAKTNNWKKIEQKHFHTIRIVRNAFAHSDTEKETIGITVNEGKAEVNDIYYCLESVDSSGKFIREKRKDAFDRFTQSYVVLEKYLHEILKALTESSS
jgi:hypothetical protein